MWLWLRENWVIKKQFEICDVIHMRFKEPMVDGQVCWLKKMPQKTTLGPSPARRIGMAWQCYGRLCLAFHPRSSNRDEPTRERGRAYKQGSTTLSPAYLTSYFTSLLSSSVSIASVELFFFRFLQCIRYNINYQTHLNILFVINFKSQN